MNDRTFRSYVMLILACSTLLTAHCGPEPEPPRPAEIGAATLRWRTWETTSQVEQTLMAQFQAIYPQVEFERRSIEEPINNLLNATPLPDLFNIEAGTEFDGLIRQNRLADLTEIWNQSALQTNVPQSLQTMTVRDGKQFYVPLGFGWVGIYYNKQIFADYDLTPPTTWEEFIQICATLRAQGETPLAIAGNEPWASYLWFEYLNLRLNGASFQRGLITGKEHFDDPRIYTVLETWKSLFDNGYFVENPQMLGSLQMMAALLRSERAQMLTREKAVMVLADTYNSSQLPAVFMDELDFFRFPIMDAALPTTEVVYPFGYAVPLGADHAPQALAFLLHLTTPTAQALIAKEGIFSGTTYAPARQDVDLTLLRADQRQALDLLNETDETLPHMWLAMPRGVWGLMTFEFTRFIRAPHDVDIFIQKLEAVRQKALANGQLTGE